MVYLARSVKNNDNNNNSKLSNLVTWGGGEGAYGSVNAGQVIVLLI